MKRPYVLSLSLLCFGLWLTGTAVTSAQKQAPVLVAPTVFRVSGTLLTPAGAPRTGSVTLVASIYSDQTDPSTLWTELQTVTLDANGRYSILVGSTVDGGVSKELFLNGAGRWLGVGVQGETEQPRIMLVTVPYALRALDADTLAGKTAADFVLSENLGNTVKNALKDPNSSDPLGNVTTTVGTIAKFSDTIGSVANSIMGESAGKIGINQASPSATFDVNGSTNFGGDANQVSTGGWYWGAPGTFNIGMTGNSSTRKLTFVGSNAVAMTLDGLNQRLGIGTATPATTLDVNGLGRFGSDVFQVSTGGWYWGNPSTYVVGLTGNATNGRLSFIANSAVVATMDASGNFGVGTSTPTAKLDVVGSINVSGNINAKYQDVAEWVDAPEPLDAGTVVIVDPTSPNRVIASAKAYDTRIAGAVSAMPGLVLGDKGDNKEMVAQGGRVRIKVDASYGAIKIGDILVTSDTPGHAMISRPVRVGDIEMHRPGTILGRALEAWSDGKGMILVLLGSQ